MTDQQITLLETLQKRFVVNSARHPGVEWGQVQSRLEAAASKLKALAEMEATGGEPDVAGSGLESGAFVFVDFSPESPSGRRSLCYDRKALDGRKENKPAGNAVELAASWGAELLTEEQYRDLQALGEFDRKTSSWVKTPTAIRDLGGALFCNSQYHRVFVYYNGAESYYGVRGFRCRLEV
ncbi:MAG: DUF4256 domain-containing protein [Spirochaetales bacterium]